MSSITVQEITFLYLYWRLYFVVVGLFLKSTFELDFLNEKPICKRCFLLPFLGLHGSIVCMFDVGGKRMETCPLFTQSRAVFTTD